MSIKRQERESDCKTNLLESEREVIADSLQLFSLVENLLKFVPLVLAGFEIVDHHPLFTNLTFQDELLLFLTLEFFLQRIAGVRARGRRRS